MLKLKIVSPERVEYTGEVESVKVPGTQGNFEILTDHAPIISSLQKGVVEYGGQQLEIRSEERGVHLRGEGGGLMVLAVSLSALLLTLLGVAYVKGYDAVKSRSPEHLVHFYLIMATVRMLLAGTAVALLVLLADNRADAIRLAISFIIMYVAMMVITLWLRH